MSFIKISAVILILTVFFIFMYTCPSGAEDADAKLTLPMKFQQGILFKCLPHAKGIVSRASEALKIGVLYDEEHLESKKEFDQVFADEFHTKKIGDLPVKLIFIDKSNYDFSETDSINDYLPRLEEFPKTDILFILCTLTGKEIELLLQFTTARKTMSVSGIKLLVDAGVSLGILLNPETKKPQMIIYLKTAEAEECNFNPLLFRLAKVIK